ncbi:hypothetical protein B6S44_28935 [Bosea sp. Tri-44]|uniref:DUF6894 family protein n=1 Tax=Bosea sp. Tri-44 TaxID=1972137 RepID=UPI00101004B5|nr:hypothetical protein [Bosea sp. Tri-44]RXT43091.1 hypothetical protein B6S44_28935 [Bosea sp. Tri-44]
MPIYRVSTEDGEKFEPGDEMEFANDKAASDNAQRALADMAHEQLPNGSHLKMKVAVQNEAEDIVYQASLEFRGETAEDMKTEAAKAARKSKN